MTSAFKIPQDGSIYATSLFTRCRELVGYSFWSGLQRSRLDAWIANFKTNEERYFAAKVLDALIYRSDDQTVALLRQLFTRVIPDYARIHSLIGGLRDIYTALRHPTADPRIRVVPVIPPSSPPTKSGPLIARHLKRSLRFNEQWIIYPDQVSSLIGSVDAFVFVDDFLGTGDQFSRFLVDTNLDRFKNDACFIYGSLAGHEQGLGLLQALLPSVHVATVDRLDDCHAFFHTKGGSFPDGVNSAEVARDFYYAMLIDRGINISGAERRGYGHLEVVYAFEHAVPDNSLPILWWSHSDHWRPLFDR